MRRAALLVLSFAVLATVPTLASAKGGAGGGGGGGGGTSPCVSISLPKPVEAVNLAGKTDWTVQLQSKISSCSGGTYVIDVVEITGIDPASPEGSFYEGCALPSFTAGIFSLKAGDSKSFNFTTPALPLPVCTHWLRETLRDVNTGETFGPVVQRIDSTTRI